MGGAGWNDPFAHLESIYIQVMVLTACAMKPVLARAVSAACNAASGGAGAGAGGSVDARVAPIATVVMRPVQSVARIIATMRGVNRAAPVPRAAEDTSILSCVARCSSLPITPPPPPSPLATLN
jgi:hypothetical protein